MASYNITKLCETHYNGFGCYGKQEQRMLKYIRAHLKTGEEVVGCDDGMQLGHKFPQTGRYLETATTSLNNDSKTIIIAWVAQLELKPCVSGCCLSKSSPNEAKAGSSQFCRFDCQKNR
jgi:hypothetical protein